MLSERGFLNDGSNDPPKLRVYLNLGTLDYLQPDSLWNVRDTGTAEEQLTKDGFAGVQLVTDDPRDKASTLPFCGQDRINTPQEADAIVARHALRGDSCLTVHAGWGLEDDDESLRLVDAIIAASEQHRLPVFIETHRATITQDLWRTVQLAAKIPQIRFNGDFSHYYCGHELVYGDWQSKLTFMKPIFERVGFMHGRIASPGCMQVPIDAFDGRPTQAHGDIDYLDHFKQLWQSAMQSFLSSAQAGDVLIFAPELLSGKNYYARLFPNHDGVLSEESDRYEQALRYKSLAESCFDTASKQTAGTKR